MTRGEAGTHEWLLLARDIRRLTASLGDLFAAMYQLRRAVHNIEQLEKEALA